MIDQLVKSALPKGCFLFTLQATPPKNMERGMRQKSISYRRSFFDLRELVIDYITAICVSNKPTCDFGFLISDSEIDLIIDFVIEQIIDFAIDSVIDFAIDSVIDFVIDFARFL